MSVQLLSADTLELQLRQIGQTRYHHLHPFHRLLHDGKLSRGQVQAWALNRYYYQSQIPVKDALLLARLPTAALRREWRRRLEDQDGRDQLPGGGARWLKLAEGVGLDPEMVERAEAILPATRFAVDAYVHFVRDRSVLEAVASSLTELFAPSIIAERVSGMLAHYSWVTAGHPGVFHATPHAGSHGQRLCSELRQGTRRHARAPAAGARRAALQVRRALGATGCALLQLRGSESGAARRVRTAGELTSMLSDETVPKFAGRRPIPFR